MNTPLYETERLYLREMTPEDAPFAYTLNADPDVLKYTGDDSFDSIDEAREFLSNYDHYRHYGFGRWAVVLKSTNEVIGWCGLKYIADLDEFDIGFRFLKTHWNQGYASEAASVCLKAGFNHFKMPEIVGRAMKDNLGSIRVLEKIGLSYYKDYQFDEEDGVIYKISKSEFERN